MKRTTNNKILTILMIAALALGSISGCGSSSDKDGIDTGKLKDRIDDMVEANEPVKSEDEADTEDPEPTASESGNESVVEEAPAEPEEENVWDGGPDFTSLATQFNGIFHDMTIEDAVSRYAITLVDGGRYYNFEGDIGQIIPEYRDLDLDGDHKTDSIRREGSHYVIECSRAGSFTTGDYSNSPNEGEVFEFEDTACRNIDEILIAHYTFGTGGPVVWDTAIYSNASGEWKAYPIVDADNKICSEGLRDHIAARTGKPYEPSSVTVSSVDMQTILLNYGHKDGPVVTLDYEPVYLNKTFFKQSITDDEYEYYDYSDGFDTMTMINHWPLEIVGTKVQLTPSLQSELNTYLSNFSEQNYNGRYTPASVAHFAMEWAKINSPSKLEYDNNYCKISHASVNEILGRYFGSNMEESEFYSSDEDNVHRGFAQDEYYCEPAADGEMYAYNAFSVVTSVEELGEDYGNKYLRMQFTVYSLDTDDYDETGITKAHYALSADEAKALASSGRLYESYTGTAIAKKVGKDYWLLEYSVPLDY